MAESDPFAVPGSLHLLSECVYRAPAVWLGLGRLETLALAEPLRAVRLDRPIFVCGLARSGSTLLHELIASHPGVATHRAKDYPLVFTPWWWRQATRAAPATPPRERAHGDGMLISSESPEALEEMIWTAFFPRCHDPRRSNIFDETARHPGFESFYRAHLGKLQLAEQATRYVAKANYHVARLRYLLRLFPDARFILPVREPASHLASLARQHRRFCQGERRHPRALAYMRRAGHFEFGLDRRPIHLGEDARVASVHQAWAAGQEWRGWARYWAMVHDFLADQLAASRALRTATLVVRHEEMCASPQATIEAILAHCELPDVATVCRDFARRSRRSDYGEPEISTADRAAVREETRLAARR